MTEASKLELFRSILEQKKSDTDKKFKSQLPALRRMFDYVVAEIQEEARKKAIKEATLWWRTKQFFRFMNPK